MSLYYFTGQKKLHGVSTALTYLGSQGLGQQAASMAALAACSTCSLWAHSSA